MLMAWDVSDVHKWDGNSGRGVIFLAFPLKLKPKTRIVYRKQMHFLAKNITIFIVNRTALPIITRLTANGLLPLNPSVMLWRRQVFLQMCARRRYNPAFVRHAQNKHARTMQTQTARAKTALTQKNKTLLNLRTNHVHAQRVTLWPVQSLSLSLRLALYCCAVVGDSGRRRGWFGGGVRMLLKHSKSCEAPDVVDWMHDVENGCTRITRLLRCVCAGVSKRSVTLKYLNVIWKTHRCARNTILFVYVCIQLVRIL